MICLTRDELVELTGYRRPHTITRWLRDNVIQFYVGADGWPRVLRNSSFDERKTLTKSVPNIAALQDMQRGHHGKAKKATARPS
jgi:hypothetical protein